MKPKSLYRAALLEYLYCASFAADSHGGHQLPATPSL